MFEHKDQGRDLAIFESEVSQQINSYLNQEPRPSIEMIADYLGVYNLVQIDKRRGAKTLNIPEVKKEVARRTWEQAQKQHQNPKLPLLPEYIEKIVTPPDEGEIIPGSGKGIEAKRVFPRTQYLLELFQEHGIAFENPIAGRNSPHMMREDHTYFFFYIPSLHVAVNVNNQEGNATFIFYQVPDKDTVKNTLVPLSKKSYEDPHLNSYPMVQVNWTDDKESWKLAILDALTAPIQKTEKNELSASQTDQELDPKLQKYLAELKQAYEEWKSEAEETRGKFNTEWLRKHGFRYTYDWAMANGGLEAFLRFAPAEIQLSFQVKHKKRRDRATALQELEQAHNKWKSEPQETRGAFSPAWFGKNNFHALYDWINERENIKQFITQAAPEIQKDFEIVREKSIKQMIDEFEKAYQKWKSEAEETRGRFNSAWMRKNKFGYIYSWAEKHMGMRLFVTYASPEAQIHFTLEERKTPVLTRNETQALIEIQQAYQIWKSEAEETRGRFNTTWIQKNKFAGLYDWAHKNGGIDALIAKAAPEIQEVFTHKKSNTLN